MSIEELLEYMINQELIILDDGGKSPSVGLIKLLHTIRLAKPKSDEKVKVFSDQLLESKLKPLRNIDVQSAILKEMEIFEEKFKTPPPSTD